MGLLSGAATTILVLVLLIAPAAAESLEAVLRFEVEHTGETPAGWGGGPPETIHLDGEIVHEGAWSVRLTRDATSASTFSTITKAIPLDFAGGTISLVGYLRLENVTDFAGLWMREDGVTRALAFDNMQQRQLKGSLDWAEYRIDLPLVEDADEVYFGALVAGEGQLWVDDLRLLVDDRPVATALPREVGPTVLDTDHEFDDGSGIDVAQLSKLQVQNVVRLGKVWGFLKYHHPRVTAGELHWDYELFRVLPSVLQALDASAANAALTAWVDGLGEVAPCGPCASPPADPHLSAELDWISDRDWLGEELCQRLEWIHRNRPAQGEQFYVDLVPGVRNAIFRNELPYPTARPDAGYRILALLRYWNVIEYWFPYRDVIGEDWNGVLASFVPRLVEATESTEYRRQLIQLIARVHDTHANLWGALETRPPWGDCRLPVRLRFLQDSAVVSALRVPADSTALRVGDVIETLDGRGVDELVAQWQPYYAASNEPTRRRNIAREMTKGECGPCAVQVHRETARVELRAKRRDMLPDKPQDRWHHRPGSSFQKLGDDVAYLKLAPIVLNACARYIRQAAGTKGLVIDIRNYPSEFVVFELGQHLVDESTPFARFTRGDLANPGAFSWTDPVRIEPAEPRYEGQIVILVDETSQSQAEYTSMAFRAAPGALVVGSTTAGADGNVSSLVLPGGLRTMISGIGVFYPDKTATQRVGIVPDVEVLPTVQGIREGRDEVLEAALRQILGPVSDEELQQRLSSR